MFERAHIFSITLRKRACCAVLTAMLVGLFASTPARCAETEGHSQEAEREEEKRNVIVLFTGFAVEERRDDGFALGLEYNRRIGKSFGVGALAEHTFGDFDASVYVLGFAYRTGRWKATLGPGIEDSREGSEGLVRIGAEYAFEVGAWEISPQLDIDFVDGDEVFVIGVAYGFGF